jgi:hypothetical protein
MSLTQSASTSLEMPAHVVAEALGYQPSPHQDLHTSIPQDRPRAGFCRFLGRPPYSPEIPLSYRRVDAPGRLATSAHIPTHCSV